MGSCKTGRELGFGAQYNKTEQKATSVLSCPEENLPKIPDPSRKKKKNECEIQKTEINPSHKSGREWRKVRKTEKEAGSWPLGSDSQCSKEIQPRR